MKEVTMVLPIPGAMAESVLKTHEKQDDQFHAIPELCVYLGETDIPSSTVLSLPESETKDPMSVSRSWLCMVRPSNAQTSGLLCNKSWEIFRQGNANETQKHWPLVVGCFRDSLHGLGSDKLECIGNVTTSKRKHHCFRSISATGMHGVLTKEQVFFHSNLAFLHRCSWPWREGQPKSVKTG